MWKRLLFASFVRLNQNTLSSNAVPVGHNLCFASSARASWWVLNRWWADAANQWRRLAFAQGCVPRAWYRLHYTCYCYLFLMNYCVIRVMVQNESTGKEIILVVLPTVVVLDLYLGCGNDKLTSVYVHTGISHQIQPLALSLTNWQVFWFCKSIEIYSTTW